MPQILSPLLVETPSVSNVVVTILPSGDSTGATDVTNINNVLTAGGQVNLVYTGSSNPYYINAPLTPTSGSSIRGRAPWMASAIDNYGAGSGGSGGSVIKVVSSFSGTAAIKMYNTTSTQYYGVSLVDFTLDGSVMTAGYGIQAHGAWGACIMRGVAVNSVWSDALHFETDTGVGKNPDDWFIDNCKFSYTAGYGVYADNLPDSWFVNCESSANSSDNWNIAFSLNTHFIGCKGEGSTGGAGFHFTGQGGAGRALNLIGCTTHANNKDGFLFDNSASGSGGRYILSGCYAIGDGLAGGTTYAGYRANGSLNVVMASNCYAQGAAYGASQTSTSAGMTFTGSDLSGTTASTHDDASNTVALLNLVPVNVTSVPIANGGTGATTASAALTALGGAALAGTTMTGYLAPAVTALTDGSSVSINAANGNVFTWALGGSSHTLGAPSNPVNGQQIVIDIAYSGAFTPLFNAAFLFGADGQPTWTSTSGKTDAVAFRYSTAKSGWLCQGWKLGF